MRRARRARQRAARRQATGSSLQHPRGSFRLSRSRPARLPPQAGAGLERRALP